MSQVSKEKLTLSFSLLSVIGGVRRLPSAQSLSVSGLLRAARPELSWGAAGPSPACHPVLTFTLTPCGQEFARCFYFTDSQEANNLKD